MISCAVPYSSHQHCKDRGRTPLDIASEGQGYRLTVVLWGENAGRLALGVVQNDRN